MDSQNAISNAKKAASENDFKTAQRILKKVLTQEPRNVEAWLQLAEVVEKPDLKVKSYEQVLKIDPDNETARQKLFYCLQEVSELNKFKDTLAAEPQTLTDRLQSVSTPSTELDDSGQDVSTPTTGFDSPLQDGSTLSSEFDEPWQDVSTPTTEFDSPLQDVSTPSTELDDLWQDTSTPTTEFDSPLQDVSTPSIEIDDPWQDTSTPSAELDDPWQDASTPSVELDDLRQDFSSPSAELDDPWQGEPLPAAPSNQDTPAASAPNKPKKQKRPAQKQDKKRGRWLEISLIGVLAVTAFCVLGLFFLIPNRPAVQGGGISDTEPPAENPMAVIIENIKASNAENVDHYMSTIHSKSPSYQSTKNMAQEAFSLFDLSYKVSGLKIIKQTKNEVTVAFTLTTRKIRGPNFRDNRVNGEMILRQEDGSWKIYNQVVHDVKYLN